MVKCSLVLLGTSWIGVTKAASLRQDLQLYGSWTKATFSLGRTIFRSFIFYWCPLTSDNFFSAQLSSHTELHGNIFGGTYAIGKWCVGGAAAVKWFIQCLQVSQKRKNITHCSFFLPAISSPCTFGTEFLLLPTFAWIMTRPSNHFRMWQISEKLAEEQSIRTCKPPAWRSCPETAASSCKENRENSATHLSHKISSHICGIGFENSNQGKACFTSTRMQFCDWQCMRDCLIGICFNSVGDRKNSASIFHCVCDKRTHTLFPPSVIRPDCKEHKPELELVLNLFITWNTTISRSNSAWNFR